ncbi:hypothetical protein DY000_02028440 [Brassica cretica]|uniref:C2 NT-type domain-containing protein n=1 Tax=Brassica cretica TaxID=69181 RepID=A0ABQ7DEQ3_BRACR|nr:hypothetical protein DY000_02028440 [Brassica cretica]
MSISKLNFKIGFANSQLHQRFTVDTEGTRKRARYHWKDLDASFSDHLSDRQIDVRVDHFRDVSVRTADIETLGAIYIDCSVPVMLGGPIGSETR